MRIARDAAAPAALVRRQQAPLVGDRPLATTLGAAHGRSGLSAGVPPAPPPAPAGHLQRSAETAQPDAGSDVRIDRSEPVAAAAQAIGARAFSRDGDVYIPAAAGALDSGPGRGLLAHEMTHVRQQRSLGSALPVPHSEQGIALEAAARGAESWARTSELSLARAGRMEPQMVTGSGDRASLHSAASPTSELRGGFENDTFGANGGGRAEPRAATIQLATDEPAAAPAPQGPAPESGGAPAGMGERQLQDLLRQLYPKLRFELANELLVSRERSGHLTDLY